ncbi:unnamed protein product [Blepharisma stoltei]|uniref:Uncharacterized protein n=1 Tax=Blepharisma stoltei TaxID=1481888 RepID=A0AAU9JD07_9CILI|nr:unnamed protein product [Blepharisma stoltei]
MGNDCLSQRDNKNSQAKANTLAKENAVNKKEMLLIKKASLYVNKLSLESIPEDPSDHPFLNTSVSLNTQNITIQYIYDHLISQDEAELLSFKAKTSEPETRFGMFCATLYQWTTTNKFSDNMKIEPSIFSSLVKGMKSDIIEEECWSILALRSLSQLSYLRQDIMEFASINSLVETLEVAWSQNHRHIGWIFYNLYLKYYDINDSKNIALKEQFSLFADFAGKFDDTVKQALLPFLQ